MFLEKYIILSLSHVPLSSGVMQLLGVTCSTQSQTFRLQFSPDSSLANEWEPQNPSGFTHISQPT